MNAIQLDFFEDNDDMSLIKKELKEMRISLDKQRKSLFAKQNEMGKVLIELKEEIYRLNHMLKNSGKNASS